jgi:hypothetical protein
MYVNAVAESVCYSYTRGIICVVIIFKTEHELYYSLRVSPPSTLTIKNSGRGPGLFLRYAMRVPGYCIKLLHRCFLPCHYCH